jgi:prepilin-type N-terminal cleavage/methylation domain-containing protein
MSLAHKKFVKCNTGFTLIEVISATAILALIASSVWVVIDRCVCSAADSKIKMHAFEVARENLETILSMPSVKEKIQYGASERYPEIEWETVVETFFEPVNSQMWLRAVCTASYYNSKGDEQSVELVHWLAGLSKEQLLAVLMRHDDSNDNEPLFQVIETAEDAAIYAGVSPDDIQKWLDNGMKTTDDGFFLKNNLDLFKKNSGTPSETDKTNLQITSEDDLKRLMTNEEKEQLENEIEPTTGMTFGQLEQMDIQQIWGLLKNKQAGDTE